MAEHGTASAVSLEQPPEAVQEVIQPRDSR